MKNVLRAMGATLLLLVAAGCGGGGESNATPPTPLSYPNLDGNWNITATSTVYAGLATPIGASLSNVKGSITGAAHIFKSSCYTIETDLPVTGTMDTKGNVSVKSPLINGQ